MINIGIIGYGFMGRTHASAYVETGRATITAIADARPDRIARRSDSGNIGPVDGPDLNVDDLFITEDVAALLDRDEIDAVSICTPTPSHAALAIAAMERGKHVLVEKPLALDSETAMTVVEAASQHPELICMPAMCMRFWPGWTWLKRAIDERTYGRVISANFVRLGARPTWGDGFYANHARTGGGALDLHLHDVDFIRYCFGEPRTVTSHGSIDATGGVDHISTLYHFEGDDEPQFVTAEGGWMRAEDFAFTMRYRVNFEQHTVVFDLSSEPAVAVYRNGEARHPDLGDQKHGYNNQAQHFIDCIESSRQPSVVTIADGAASVAVVECELQSVRCGKIIAVPQPNARALDSGVPVTA